MPNNVAQDLATKIRYKPKSSLTSYSTTSSEIEVLAELSLLLCISTSHLSVYQANSNEH